MESRDVMISILNAGYEAVNGMYKKDGAVWVYNGENGNQFVIGMDTSTDGPNALCLWEFVGEDKVLRYVDRMERGRVGGIEELTLEAADAAEPVPQVVMITDYQFAATESEVDLKEEEQLSEMSGMLGDDLTLGDTKALRKNSATSWTDEDLEKLQSDMEDEMTRIARDRLRGQFEKQDSLRWKEKTAVEVAEENLEWRIEQRADIDDLVARGIVPPELKDAVKGSKDYEEALEDQRERRGRTRDSISAQISKETQSHNEFRVRTIKAEKSLTWKFGQRADLSDLIARGIVPPELVNTVKGPEDYDPSSVGSGSPRKRRSVHDLEWKFGQRSPVGDLVARGIVPEELAETVQGDQDYDGVVDVDHERHEFVKEQLADKFVARTEPPV